MPTTITTNMGLIVPTVGAEPGPTWASDLNSDLGILDQHDHSPGQGAQITPSGLNINSDLSLNSNNLTAVKTVNFTAQLATLPGLTPDLGCIYVAGNELVYNDEAGNVVQITNNGSVNAGAGSITGLPSGTAGVSYSSIAKTYVFQSATSTPANLDFASGIFRNLVANSFGLTLNPPAAMAADYTVTLPPSNGLSATAFLTYDASNNMNANVPLLGALTTANLSPTAGITGGQIASATITGSNIASQTITQGLLAARSTGSTVGVGGVAVSASSGSFNTNSTSGVFVTNLSVTITTTGRPVRVFLVGDGNPSTSSFIGVESADPCSCNIILYNGATILSQNTIQIATGSGSTAVQNFIPVSSLSTLDMTVNGVPGTYTYQVLMQVSSATYTGHVLYAQLVAYEI